MKESAKDVQTKVEANNRSGWCSGYHDRLTRDRSWVQSPHPILFFSFSSLQPFSLIAIRISIQKPMQPYAQIERGRQFDAVNNGNFVLLASDRNAPHLSPIMFSLFRCGCAAATARCFQTVRSGSMIAKGCLDNAVLQRSSLLHAVSRGFATYTATVVSSICP